TARRLHIRFRSRTFVKSPDGWAGPIGQLIRPCHEFITPGFRIIMSVRFARLFCLALIGACFSTAATAATKSGSLVWRGDDATANAVMNEVGKAWTKAGHGRIELQPFNTASGLDAVTNGSAQNDRLTFTPVAWSGLVIITQASNPIGSLTLKQVHDIYYGKIHNWSEV